MSESVVIVPSTANQDWDFLGFSFNGKHSWDDFKIIRISDGDRYNINLGPQSQDKTAENSGGDGMYFFGSNHKQKVFDIKFAFEELDDVQLREMKRWLSGKEVGDLWFDEEPYKVYSAKVTGQPRIRIIPFDNYDANGEKIARVYKGDGSVQFTCYWPYAHTPDYVGYSEITLQANTEVTLPRALSGDFLVKILPDIEVSSSFELSYYAGGWIKKQNIGSAKEAYFSNINITKIQASEAAKIRFYQYNGFKYAPCSIVLNNGKDQDSYSYFNNKIQWAGASGLTSSTGACNGENPGELPAPFMFKYNDGTVDITISENTSKTFKVGDLEITVGGIGSKSLTDVTWDSKTGMVSAKVGGAPDYTPIPYTGTSIGAIPVGGTTALDLDGGTLTYHYWYY